MIKVRCWLKFLGWIKGKTDLWKGWDIVVKSVWL